MPLSRDEFLAIDDLTIKEIAVPDTIPVWGGKKLMIRQLSRGEQDAHSKRQFGDARMKTQKRDAGGEISIAGIFGHDAWLCVRGVCDEHGKPIFTDKDIPALNAKSGEAIGWIAQEIVKFSGMAGDVPLVESKPGDDTPEQEALKN